MTKKVLTLAFVVILSLTIFSVMSFGAFDGYALRFNNQEILDKLALTNTTVELKDGYATLTSTQHDPNVIYKFEGDDVLNADKYKYAVVKYRTSYKQDGLISEFYFHSDASNYKHPDTHVTYAPTTDGEWVRAVINFGSLAAWAGEIKSIRFDYLEGSNLPADSALDIEYIAFFETEEAAKAFDDNFDAEPTNPETFDQSILFVYVALVALAGIVAKKKLAF